jgi:hypothetical protein
LSRVNVQQQLLKTHNMWYVQCSIACTAALLQVLRTLVRFNASRHLCTAGLNQEYYRTMFALLAESAKFGCKSFNHDNMLSGSFSFRISIGSIKLKTMGAPEDIKQT